MHACAPHQHRRQLRQRVVLRACSWCLCLLVLMLLARGGAAAEKSSSKTCKADGAAGKTCAAPATTAGATSSNKTSATATTATPKKKGGKKAAAQAAPAPAAAAAGGSALTRRAGARRAADGDAAAAVAAAQQGGNSAAQAEQLAHLQSLVDVADVYSPPKSAADRGSYVDFLLLVSEVGSIPKFTDPHFNPVVVPVMPPRASGRPRQQLGPAGDMLEVLAAHRAQFIVSVGNETHFDFLRKLPAQYRATWFHLPEPQHVTQHTIETFFWRAIRLPPGGSPREPLLSVFTPVLTHAAANNTPDNGPSNSKIKAAYWSLLDQRYSNWEWLVFDDSAPGDDAIWKELSALKDADPRVQVFRTDRPDGFVGSVKAQACQQAMGQLLVELDQDAELMPDALELLKDALVANPDAGFFYSDSVELREGSYDSVDYGPDWAYGQGLQYRTLLDGHWVAASASPPLNDRTLRGLDGVPRHVRAWRRDAYLALGGHTRGLPVVDDYDLVLRSLFEFPAVHVRHMSYLKYHDPEGDAAASLRSELTQRLSRLTAADLEGSIRQLLASHNMSDGGLAATTNYTKMQYDAAPTGPTLARSYHAPTAKAPAEQPHVTVVIPTFNNTKGLKAAIRSVLAQDYGNWELLIVGDACPKLEQFMEKNTKLLMGSNHTVRYANLPERGDGGFFAPLNAALRGLVASQWVAYLKDSSRWTPEHLSSLAAVYAEDPSRSYVFGSLQMNDQVLIADDPRLYRMDTSAVMHHMRLIQQYGGWRSTAEVGVANDWDLFKRWQSEPWGASLKPTVIMPPQASGTPAWLQEQYM